MANRERSTSIAAEVEWDSTRLTSNHYRRRHPPLLKNYGCPPALQNQHGQPSTVHLAGATLAMHLQEQDYWAFDKHHTTAPWLQCQRPTQATTDDYKRSALCSHPWVKKSQSCLSSLGRNHNPCAPQQATTVCGKFLYQTLVGLEVCTLP